MTNVKRFVHLNNKEVTQDFSNSQNSIFHIDGTKFDIRKISNFNAIDLVSWNDSINTEVEDCISDIGVMSLSPVLYVGNSDILKESEDSDGWFLCRPISSNNVMVDSPNALIQFHDSGIASLKCVITGTVVEFNVSEMDVLVAPLGKCLLKCDSDVSLILGTFYPSENNLNFLTNTRRTDLIEIKVVS